MDMIYIDDDQANRAVFEQMMQVGNVAVTAAPDVRSGLALLDRQDVSMLLVDLHMPEVSGLTAIRMVRGRSDAKASLPIVVVTAFLTKGVEQMCRAAGADAFVTKPIDMDRLFSVMGEVLAERGTTEVH